MFTGARSVNGDVSKWDVSEVSDMTGMFTGARSVNGDVSKWDVSEVSDMSFRFYECPIARDCTPRERR